MASQLAKASLYNQRNNREKQIDDPAFATWLIVFTFLLGFLNQFSGSGFQLITSHFSEIHCQECCQKNKNQ